MTCDEYTKLLGTNPFDWTSAERISHFLHYKQCESCRELEDARLGLVCISGEELAKCASMLAKDLDDPEVLEMIENFYGKES